MNTFLDQWLRRARWPRYSQTERTFFEARARLLQPEGGLDALRATIRATDRALRAALDTLCEATTFACRPVRAYHDESVAKARYGSAMQDMYGNVWATIPARHELVAYGEQGELRGRWGSRGAGDKELHYPIGISPAIQETAMVAVADSWNRRVVLFEFNNAQADVKRFLTLDLDFEPVDVTLTPDGSALWVLDRMKSRMRLIDLETQTVDQEFGVPRRRFHEIDEQTGAIFDLDAPLPPRFGSTALFGLQSPTRASGDGRDNMVFVDEGNQRLVYVTDDFVAPIDLDFVDCAPTDFHVVDEKLWLLLFAHSRQVLVLEAPGVPIALWTLPVRADAFVRKGGEIWLIGSEGLFALESPLLGISEAARHALLWPKFLAPLRREAERLGVSPAGNGESASPDAGNDDSDADDRAAQAGDAYAWLLCELEECRQWAARLVEAVTTAPIAGVAPAITAATLEAVDHWRLRLAEALYAARSSPLPERAADLAPLLGAWADTIGPLGDSPCFADPALHRSLCDGAWNFQAKRQFANRLCAFLQRALPALAGLCGWRGDEPELREHVPAWMLWWLWSPWASGCGALWLQWRAHRAFLAFRGDDAPDDEDLRALAELEDEVAAWREAMLTAEDTARIASFHLPGYDRFCADIGPWHERLWRWHDDSMRRRLAQTSSANDDLAAQALRQGVWRLESGARAPGARFVHEFLALPKLLGGVEFPMRGLTRLGDGRFAATVARDVTRLVTWQPGQADAQPFGPELLEQKRLANVDTLWPLADGGVWFAEAAQGALVRLAADGATIDIRRPEGLQGLEGFSRAALSPDERLIVAVSHQSRKLWRIDVPARTAAEHLLARERFDAEHAPYLAPTWIDDGRIALADPWRSRVLMVDAEGVVSSVLGAPGCRREGLYTFLNYALAWWQGLLWIADGLNRRVVAWDLDAGRLVTQIAPLPSCPVNMSVGRDGALYVTMMPPCAQALVVRAPESSPAP